MAKPQLVMTDSFIGEHNKDPEATRARLLRGASWKRQRVVVIVPSSETLPAKVALSHWNLCFPPNNGVVRILALGQEVGEAYSNAIESVLAHPDLKDWEYILTIENDNAPPGDGVIKLVEAMEAHPEFSVIGGTYFTKGPGGCCQRWGDVSDPSPNYRPMPPPQPGELGEAYGLGMGFTLFRLSLFHDTRLRRPWFKTLNGKDGVGIGTQDLYAFSDFRKYGYRCAVAGDVRVGHYDLRGDFGGIPDMMW